LKSYSCVADPAQPQKPSLTFGDTLKYKSIYILGKYIQFWLKHLMNSKILQLSTFAPRKGKHALC